MSDSSIQPQLAQAAPFTDSDPAETAEWRDALASLLLAAGPQRVREIARRRSAGSRRRARPTSTPSPPRASRPSRATWASRSAWPL
jgi:pyruvate dehydrogenase complex dehydrogenase (E1) component